MVQEEVAQSRVLACRFFGQPGDLGLLLGNQRAQAFELGSSPRALAAPTSLLARFCSACAVSAARIFARRASSSARISDDRRRQAAARKRGVESGGVFADGADVVHGGRSLGEWCPGMP